MPADNPPLWRLFHNGPYASVWIHKECERELRDLSPKDYAKIAATLTERFCAMENPQLDSQRFNPNERRHPVAGKDILVQAFKAYQGRLYGNQSSVYGHKTFLAALACVKKTNKADDALLRKAATRLHDAPTHIPGLKA